MVIEKKQRVQKSLEPGKIGETKVEYLDTRNVVGFEKSLKQDE